MIYICVGLFVFGFTWFILAMCCAASRADERLGYK